MKSIFFLFILLCSANFCSAQVVTDSSRNKVPVVEKEDDKIYIRSDISPQFPGGDTTWNRYKKINLGNFNPANNGAPKGVYEVMIRFIVRKNGTIYDIKPETNFGYGMEDIAVKLIQYSPKWLPAMHNGFIVTSFYKQLFTFIVE
jgi:periplasmic protein TonB